MSHLPTHRRNGWPARLARFKALPALAALLALVAGGPSAAVAQDPRFRLALSHSVIQSHNENDILAAMKVWAETIVREGDLEVDPDLVVLRSLEGTVAAVRERRVEGVTLSLPDYAAFPDGLLEGPFFRDEVGGSTEVEYVLVAARDGAVRGIGDLRDVRVTVHANENSDVGMAWLEAQLAARGMGRLSAAASHVELNPKASATVLNVFFGKADACLVRRSVFASVAELNPQVAARLAEVAVSEPIAPSLFAFRSGLDDSAKAILLREVLSLHESTAGQQVIAVFKADRMQELTAEEVQRSVRLFKSWVQAVEGGG